MVCDNMSGSPRKAEKRSDKMDDYMFDDYEPEYHCDENVDCDFEMLDGTGWNSDLGCYCYDGFPCPEASSMEEAEMVYWNTH